MIKPFSVYYDKYFDKEGTLLPYQVLELACSDMLNDISKSVNELEERAIDSAKETIQLGTSLQLAFKAIEEQQKQINELEDYQTHLLDTCKCDSERLDEIEKRQNLLEKSLGRCGDDGCLNPPNHSGGHARVVEESNQT